MKNQYQTVTDRIVAMLESGVRPWARPWQDGAPVTGALQRPLRICGTPYTGVNVVNLWCASQARGFSSRHWLTYKGASELGGQVRKGSKAEMAFYVGRHTVTEERNGEDTEREISFLRAYFVFNADEIDGLPARFYATTRAPIAAPELPAHLARAQAFADNTGAIVRHGGNRAFYAPSLDTVTMPMLAQFREPGAYYATLLHELAHWTSAPARCDRTLGKRFGDNAYAVEELVAELSAAFLCADLDIDAAPRADHASYLAHWIGVLKADNRAIFKAATLAEGAARYLHGRQPAPIAEPAPAPIPEPAPIAEPAPAPAAPEPAPAEPPPAAPTRRQRRAPKPVAAPAAPMAPPAGKTAVGASYRDSADFLPALSAAKRAAGWDMRMTAERVWCRVPATWTRVAVFGRVVRGPRDMAIPPAQYWPGGKLPLGPVYAAPAPAARMAYPVDPTPANVALWARAHGLVRCGDGWEQPQIARVMAAKEAQELANKERAAA